MPDMQNTTSSAGSNPADQNTESTNGTSSESGEKTYTKDEVSKMMQERVNELNKSNDKKTAEAIENAKAEWERQAKLSKEELAREQEVARDKEVQDLRHELTMRDRKETALAKLAENDVPASLVNSVIDEDEDVMNKNIENLSRDWKKAVEEGVKARLKSGTPTDLGTKTSNQKKFAYGRQTDARTTSL